MGAPIAKVQPHKVNAQLTMSQLSFESSTDMTKVRVVNKQSGKDVSIKASDGKYFGLIYINPACDYTVYYNKAKVSDIPARTSSLTISA